MRKINHKAPLLRKLATPQMRPSKSPSYSIDRARELIHHRRLSSQRPKAGSRRGSRSSAQNSALNIILVSANGHHVHSFIPSSCLLTSSRYYGGKQDLPFVQGDLNVGLSLASTVTYVHTRGVIRTRIANFMACILLTGRWWKRLNRRLKGLKEV